MKTEVVINSGLGSGLGGRTSASDREQAAISVESARSRPPAAGQSSSIFDAAYLARLRNGDEETAKHFNLYFRRMLRIKVWAKSCRARQEDLIDEVMAAAMEKILNGQPKDPACLPAYIRSICVNLAGKPRLTHYSADFDFDRVSDHAHTAEENMLVEERAKTVRAVLATLKARDRDILVDLFYRELDRDEVCKQRGVTREQLRLVLFRARGRFQQQWRKE